MEVGWGDFMVGRQLQPSRRSLGLPAARLNARDESSEVRGWALCRLLKQKEKQRSGRGGAQSWVGGVGKGSAAPRSALIFSACAVNSPLLATA